MTLKPIGKTKGQTLNPDISISSCNFRIPRGVSDKIQLVVLSLKDVGTQLLCSDLKEVSFIHLCVHGITLSKMSIMAKTLNQGLHGAYNVTGISDFVQVIVSMAKKGECFRQLELFCHWGGWSRKQKYRKWGKDGDQTIFWDAMINLFKINIFAFSLCTSL